LGLACAGCIAHVDANMKIDGAAFAPTSCASPRRYDARQVELVDGLGRRLRLDANANGSADVIYFEPGAPADVGTFVGACAFIELRPQASQVGGSPNVEGSARLSCDGGRHRIEGSVRFENCR
jgi:hypothetical protein